MIMNKDDDVVDAHATVNHSEGIGK